MCCRIPNRDDTDTSQSGQAKPEDEVDRSGVEGSLLIVRSRVRLFSSEPNLNRKFPIEPPATPSAMPTTAAVSLLLFQTIVNYN